MDVFPSVNLREANLLESKEKSLLEVEKVPLSEGRGHSAERSPFLEVALWSWPIWTLTWTIKALWSIIPQTCKFNWKPLKGNEFNLWLCLMSCVPFAPPMATVCLSAILQTGHNHSGTLSLRWRVACFHGEVRLAANQPRTFRRTSTQN